MAQAGSQACKCALVDKCTTHGLCFPDSQYMAEIFLNKLAGLDLHQELTRGSGSHKSVA